MQMFRQLNKCRTAEPAVRTCDFVAARSLFTTFTRVDMTLVKCKCRESIRTLYVDMLVESISELKIF